MHRKLLYILASLPLHLFAQVNLIYFNPEVPQSNYLNPALHSKCKVVVGMPMLNGISAHVAHSGFTFNQLFTENADNTFSPDPDNALKKTGFANHLYLNAEVSDIFFSVKIKNTFFNFSVRDRADANLSYGKDAAKLGLKGNTPFEGKWANARNSGAYFSYLRQYSLGFSRTQSDYLDVGTRVNLLFGKAHMNLNPKRSRMFTNGETFGVDIEMDAEYHSALPYIIEYNENTDFHHVQVDQDPIDILLNRDNKGVSVDLGFVYEYYEDLKIYGSLLDLGFISYKRNITNYEAEGGFFYNGPPENEYFDHIYFLELANTIDDSIDVSLTRENYIAILPARLYLGGEKTVNDKLSAGILLASKFYNTNRHYYLGLHSNYKLTQHVDVLTSWSWAHRSIFNIGTGLSFNLLPVNFYLATDNILGFFMPRNSKNVNIQFGLNLKFGCKEKISDLGPGCSWIETPKQYQVMKKERKR